jgi:hypothetical protein
MKREDYENVRNIVNKISDLENELKVLNEVKQFYELHSEHEQVVIDFMVYGVKILLHKEDVLPLLEKGSERIKSKITSFEKELELL